MSTSSISIGGAEISVKEFDGKRVITFRDIDAAHARPDGTARRNFSHNKKHFIQDTDYFVRNSSEAYKDFGISAPNGLTLITESGYLMLVKSFTDDLAWSVQRELVDNYFRPTPEAPPLPEPEPEKLKRDYVTIDEMQRRRLYMKDGIDAVKEHAQALNLLADQLSCDLRKEHYFSLHSVMSSLSKSLGWKLERLGKSSERAMGK